MIPELGATTILFNARVITLDPQMPVAGGLALREGVVLGIGSKEELEALRRPGTDALDLDGAVVLPGLTDAHIHLEQYANSLALIDCETDSLEDCLQLVAERTRITPPGSWILGHGWNQNRWARYGTAEDLDRVAPHNPVYLTAKSLHAGWANTAALRAAGVGHDSPDPDGGRIERSGGGRPTGILFEAAMTLLRSALPRASHAETVDRLLEAQESLWRFGLTGTHDFDGPRCFRALQEMQERSALGLRVVKNLPVDHLEEAIGLGLRSGFGNDWIRIGNVKAFADGALGPRTAAMLAPYDNDPGNTGVALLDREAIFELGARAAEHGLGITVHAIGDRANHEVLEGIAALRRYEEEHALPSRRHRIEHLQLLHPDDLRRPAELGVVASMQPVHATSDMAMANRYWGKRVQTSYAWRSQLRSGARLAFGSDAPVESPNPFWGLHAAVTRRRRDGSPGEEGWVPQERLSLHEALEAYTAGPAFAAGWEGRAGSLAPGAFADLIVLDRDPFTCNADELPDLSPVGTMVGGIWRLRTFG